jgi:hypothetical protein
LPGKIDIRTVRVTRYVVPLREGGSLPAIAEADDGFMYVVKFKGAGQGKKALIAELIAGEAARQLGLKIPEIVFADLDEAFGRTEPDEEIQDLLKASTGRNLALHYLSGAASFDPVINHLSEELASRIVWFDCFFCNVDRTVRNTNMLIWHKDLWLIDHGACLYFHHAWASFPEQAARPFTQVKDHVLLRQASELDTANEYCCQLLSARVLKSIVDAVPDEWLEDDPGEGNPQEKRKTYAAFLEGRLRASPIFLKEANYARDRII